MKQEEINKNIAKQLKDVMECKGITKAKLAQKAGISISNLYSILRGQTIPTVYTLMMVCQAMDISLASFLQPIEIRFSSIDANLISEEDCVKNIDKLSIKNKKIVADIIDTLLKYQ